MIRTFMATIVVGGISFGTGCERDAVDEKQPAATTQKVEHLSGHMAPAGDGHVHAGPARAESDQGDSHEEVDLGDVTIGDLKVSLAQGHGKVAAGQEGHLVVKLPYSDQGATAVRAWIGTEDRTLSFVGKGQYASSHDDYDIHAIAPDPLPENAKWWVEVEKPDGTKLVGSVEPLLE